MAKGKGTTAKGAKDKGKGAREELSQMSISAHPRARNGVRTARSWGGLLAFLVVAGLSYRAGVETFEAGVRALVAGLAGFLLTWMAAVAVWRQVIVAELRAAYEKRAEELRLAAEAAAKAEAEEALA